MDSEQPPHWRWTWHPATVKDSRGPERVESGKVDESVKLRPVGFTAKLDVDVEPQTWNGDNA